MVVDNACVKSGEIEVRVVCHVYNCSLVGFGFIVNGKRAGLRKCVCNFYAESSRVVLFPIRTYICEYKRGFFLGSAFGNVPDFCVEALLSSVKRVVSVILEQIVFLAFESKFSAADSVAYSADERALISRGGEISVKCVKTADYVGSNTVLSLTQMFLTIPP